MSCNESALAQIWRLEGHSHLDLCQSIGRMLSRWSKTLLTSAVWELIVSKIPVNVAIMVSSDVCRPFFISAIQAFRDPIELVICSHQLSLDVSNGKWTYG